MLVAAKYGWALVNKATGSFSYIQKSWDDSRDGAGKEERYSTSTFPSLYLLPSH